MAKAKKMEIEGPLDDVQEDVVKEEPENKDDKIPQILTSDETALQQRIAREDDTWETIKEEDIVDFSLAEDPYALPPEAKKKQDEREIAYRWAVADPKRVDELESMDPPAKWWVCNRTRTPYLEKYCDTVHGGVQKRDQLLFFKPWWMHQAYQDIKMKRAEMQDSDGDIHKRDGIAVGDTGSRWVAGEQHRITSADQVINPETLEFSDDG